MKTNRDKEAYEFLFSAYKDSLIPKSSVSIITYPDGRQVEKKSSLEIDFKYVESLKNIARYYNINLK